jgi:hypothetical protein
VQKKVVPHYEMVSSSALMLRTSFQSAPSYSCVLDIVAAFVIFISTIGPEYILLACQKKKADITASDSPNRNLGQHFEKHRWAFKEGAADDVILKDNLIEKQCPGAGPSSVVDEKRDSEGLATDDEKREVRQEHV